jgi:hypothetical protein
LFCSTLSNSASVGTVVAALPILQGLEMTLSY